MTLRKFMVFAVGVTGLTAGAGAAETPMGEAMGDASTALKSLRKLPKDDFKAAAAAVRTAHEALLKSMSYTAMMIKDMPDGLEKEKALADSRRIMGLSYAALCELELAYLEEDQEKIDAANAKVKETKKEGHRKYTDD
jgi:hypothetical protein